jgi:phosphotriesterase-related protein
MREIQGVDGPIAADRLGVALPHEHVFVDLRSYWAAPTETHPRPHADVPVTIEQIGAIRRDPIGSLDNLVLDDMDVAVAELREYKALGGDTLVELSLVDIGRDVERLREAARLSGVQIIAGCGHYVALAHPPHVAQATIEELTEQIVRELEVGVDDTGIRAGVIGEIGTTVPIHPDEDKVLRAAARAHVRTGAPIDIHLSPPPTGDWFNAHDVLDVLEEEGADLRRVLLSHLDNCPGPGEELDRALDYHRDIAKRGCFLGYDGVGKEHYIPAGSEANYGNFFIPSDQIRAKAIGRLVEDGLLDQVLLSQDVCFKIETKRYGGFGYGHILRTFTQNLADYGVEREQVRHMMVANMRRWLCGED